MKSNQEIKAAVRQVIKETLCRHVGDEERLVSSGLIDSLTILRLIGQLEKALGSRIATETSQPDDFDTILLTVETVERTLTVG